MLGFIPDNDWNPQSQPSEKFLDLSSRKNSDQISIRHYRHNNFIITFRHEKNLKQTKWYKIKIIEHSMHSNQKKYK